MKKSPLQQVKDQFGSKEALVNKLVPMLERYEDESDSEFAARLSTISNGKLLRLLSAEERVQKEFGTKSELIDKIIGFKLGERKDEGFRNKLSGYANTRLLDLHDSLARKAKRA